MIVGVSPELSRKASSIHPPGGTPGTRTAHYYFFIFLPSSSLIHQSSSACLQHCAVIIHGSSHTVTE